MKSKEVVIDKMFDGILKLSNDFKDTFPILSEMLESSYIVEFTLEGNQRYRQYIWTNEDGSTTGWLCRLEHQIPAHIPFLPEHVLLAKNMGGIVHYWVGCECEDIDTFIDANIFTFSLKDSVLGIPEWSNHYEETSQEFNIEKPLDLSKLITFALEKNGTHTIYDIDTKEVLVYLFGDYSPFEVDVKKGQSLYTFYKYAGIDSFVDYVETLGKQWRKVLN